MIDMYLRAEAHAKPERRREHPRRQAEHDWAELIEVVTSLGDAARAELAAGTDPHDPRMLELARQWRALLEHLTGDGERLPAFTRSHSGSHRRRGHT